MNKERLEINKK